MRPNKFLPLWAALACVLSSFGQETALRVVDADGRGIPGAALVGAAGTGYVTDGQGWIGLPDSAMAGNGAWLLRCLGFADRMVDAADLRRGGTYRMEEAVLDLPQALVEAVSLTGGQPLGIPGSVAVLSARELQRQGDVDVHRALRSVPGVYVQEEDGFGLRPNIGLRGSGSERSSRISVLEDGVPIAPAPYTAPSAYYFPSIGRMSGIEVLKGASQIAYGPNTIGGAVNLISTPIPAGSSGRIDGRLGDFGTGRCHVHAGSGSGRIGWLVEALQTGSRGFKELDGGGPVGFNKLDLMGKLRWTSRDGARVGQRVELKVAGVSEVSHATYSGLLAEDFAGAPFRRYLGSAKDRMDAGQRQVVLTHVLELKQGWRWTHRAYATRFDRDWYKVDRVAGEGQEWVKLGALLASADTSAVWRSAMGVFRDGADGEVRLKHNNRTYHARGVESKWTWDGHNTGWQRFEAAIRLHEDGMDRFQWTDDWHMVDGTLASPEWGLPGSESNRVEWSRAAAGYAQARWSQRGWSLYPGFRVESIRSGRDDYGTGDVERTGINLDVRRNRTVVVLPGMGFRKNLDAEWSVFAGLHRGFLPPGSDAEVAPEFAWNSEFGVRWVRAKAEATAVAFSHFGRNLQGSDFASSGGAGDGAVFNGGATRVMGIEASVKATNGVRPNEGHRLEWGVNYTFTDGRFTESFSSGFEPWGQVESGDALPYLARHQAMMQVGWYRAKWSMDGALTVAGGMRTVAGSEPLDQVATVGACTVLDATVRHRLDMGFTLVVGARNLLNAVYTAAARPAGLRPGLPRLVTGGFSLVF